MGRWAAQVVRLGAELGPTPAEDLLPTQASTLATLAVEDPEDDQHVDPSIGAMTTALHRVLGRTPRPWCGPALDAALVGLDPTWAPAQSVRLAAAVAAGLAAGHLQPGRSWALHIVDPVGAAGPALAAVLDLVGGLLDGWDPTLAPPVVTTNVGAVRRSGAGYRAIPARLSTVPDLWIELDLRPEASPAEHEVRRQRDAPSVEVRPAPAQAADPGVPAATGLPPDPAPALAAVTRWCLGDTDPGDPDEQRRQIGALLDGTAFPSGLPGLAPERAPSGAGPQAWQAGQLPSSGVWAREVADLVLAAQTDAAELWCRRARVEAGHGAGSRARHARLVAAAAQAGGAGTALRRHVASLREAGRPAWALDVWAVADAALQAQLVSDVLGMPERGAPGELALALAARLEAVASGMRTVTARQTAG